MNVNSCPKRCAKRYFPALGLLLLVGLSVLSNSSEAGKYAYGEDFVRLGKSWPDAGPQYPTVAGQGSPAQKNDFQQQLAAVEDQEGPYSDALAEPLASLGRYYRNSGDLEQATLLYRRALHVVRINDGLYSERQIPVLQELLDVYRVSGDMETLDQRYAYYFRLYGKGQPPYTEVRLRAALGYLRWQREALRRGMDDNTHRRLMDLYQLNENLLKATATDSSVSAGQYREVVLSQIRNLYLLEDRISPRLENIGRVSSAPAFAGPIDQQDLDRRRLESLQKSSFSRGKGLLLELIARQDNTGDVKALAGLHLELGDWHQWHGNASRAGQQYAQVQQLLMSGGQQVLLQKWLGQPVELPDNGAFWQPPAATSEDSPVVLKVAYDVSASGRVSNLESPIEDPNLKSKAIRLKRALKQIRFRPRWINGAAEAAWVQRDYQLLD